MPYLRRFQCRRPLEKSIYVSSFVMIDCDAAKDTLVDCISLACCSCLIACLMTVDPPAIEVDLRICGPVAMWLVLEELSVSQPLENILANMPRHGTDASFAELATFAETLGLACRAVEWEEIPQQVGNDCPAIIPVVTSEQRRHFITLLAAKGGSLKVQDFPSSARWVTETSLRQQFGWDGTALHVARRSVDLDRLTSGGVNSHWMVLLGFAVLLAMGGWLAVTRKFRFQRSRVVPSERAGYTLIDLIVAMAVLGLLMALLTPAIERSREATRRLQCQNHQRQLGLAIANFSSAHGQLPTPATVPEVSGPFGIMVGSGVSVQSVLLPYLDQASVYQQIQYAFGDIRFDASGVASMLNPTLLKKRLAVFECPSDSVPAGGCSFVLSGGTSPGLHTSIDLSPPDGAHAGYISGVRRDEASILDGLSQTVIMSERLVGDRNPGRYTVAQDHAYLQSFDGFSAATAARSCLQVGDPHAAHFSHVGTCWLASGYGYTWYNHVLTPNSHTPDCSDSHTLGEASAGCHSARSWHFGGVNAMFGDGAVRFISESIDLNVWRSLGTIQGGEAIATGGLR